MSVSVILIDKHPVVRQGVMFSLAAEPIVCHGEGQSERDARSLVSRHRPDIMVIDPEHVGGINFLQQVASEFPETRALIFTTCQDPDIVFKYLDAGFRSYILKSAPVAEMIDAITLTHTKEGCITWSLAERLLRVAREGKPKSSLTYREGQIMSGMSKGNTNKEIAVDLGITEKTVKHYVTEIFQKYNVRNRVCAINAHNSQHHTS